MGRATASQLRSILDANNLKARFADLGNFKTSSPFPGFKVHFEGMGHRAFNALAKKEEMFYGVFDSPFGKNLIAMVGGAVCRIDFVDEELKVQERLQDEYPGWMIIKNQQKCQKIQEAIFAAKPENETEIRLLAVGTAFQLNVWKTLLQIPFGKLSYYEDVARQMHTPVETSRAIGTVIGKNPIGWLIPCHRTIHKNGSLSEYKWHKSRKILMIAWEHLMMQ